MSLRYRFRHLFYGNKFHKDRMWETLEDLDARITALEESNSTPEPSGNDEPSEPSGNDTPSEPETPEPEPSEP